MFRSAILMLLLPVVLPAVRPSASMSGDDLPYQGYATSSTRGCTRLIYFNQTGNTYDRSPGQLAIEYGMPVWKDAYRTQFDQLTQGKRWRLGENLWTNLDSRFEFEVGGVKMPAGYYYLALDRSFEDDWSLLFFDPIDAFEAGFDAWHVNYRDLPELESAPLRHERVEEIQPQLKMFLQLDPKDDKNSELTIRFGPHKFTTSVRVFF